MKKIIFISSTILLLIISWSCKDKFLDLSPQTGQVTDKDFFKTKSDFDSYLFGAYTEMQGFFDGSGPTAWIKLTGFISQDLVGADELPKPLTSFMTPTNGLFQNYWVSFYKIATRANLVIDKIKTSPETIKDADKLRIMGEAEFLRGFAYFNLARAFGNVPLILTPYETSQNNLDCTPEGKVWDQVILDFKDASTKLPTKAGWGNDNIGRATNGSALAYLANAYMYKKDWPNAANTSLDLDKIGEYQLLPNVRQVFSLKNA